MYHRTHELSFCLDEKGPQAGLFYLQTHEIFKGFFLPKFNNKNSLAVYINTASSHKTILWIIPGGGFGFPESICQLPLFQEND